MFHCFASFYASFSQSYSFISVIFIFTLMVFFSLYLFVLHFTFHSNLTLLRLVKYFSIFFYLSVLRFTFYSTFYIHEMSQVFFFFIILFYILFCFNILFTGVKPLSHNNYGGKNHSHPLLYFKNTFLIILKFSINKFNFKMS